MDAVERRKLFKALVSEENLVAVLDEITSAEEYRMAKDGGEPDLEYLLVVRLLEAKIGYVVRRSTVNNYEWRSRALKRR